MEPFPFILLAVGAVGLHAAWKLARQARRAAASRTWPLAEGRIERSEVVRETSGYGSTNSIYVPRIEYAYDVAGVTHRASRIDFKGAIYTSFPDRAQAKCDRYFVGAKVPVYFDPRDPETACLERSEGSLVAGWIAAAAMGGMGLVAAGMAAWLWLGL
jgi:hypothetical protein